jgi:hypothetical protein
MVCPDLGRGALDCAFQHFSDRPLMILDSGRHCWRLLVCAVNPAEIEVENEQGNGVLMIIKSLAKTHRQAR